ncbi:MAG: hypothetical protein ACXIVQ_09670 [Acidimicrobiales bacterium]
MSMLLLVGLTLVGVGTSAPASAATVAVEQCNYEEAGDAREIRCDVTVVNTLDVATGVTSSTVTTTVCSGPPGEALCVTTTGAVTTDIVNVVNQCNNSVNAGGSTVTCNVDVVNNITGVGSTSPATVNQCIGSGQGGGDEPTTLCDPVSSASGADVIQCNTAGNDGGAAERVTCTVLTSTVSALWPVTIVQCNDSANGGGDLVTCTARTTTNILAAAEPVPTTTVDTTVVTAAETAPAQTPTTEDASATGGTAPTPTPTPGSPGAPTLPRTGSTAVMPVVAALSLLVGAVALVTAHRHGRGVPG